MPEKNENIEKKSASDVIVDKLEERKSQIKDMSKERIEISW